MKKLLFTTGFYLLLIMLVFSLHAEIYIHGELDNDQVEQDWIAAGYPDGVENIAAPDSSIYYINQLRPFILAYTGAINAVPNAIDNTQAFNKLLEIFGNPTFTAYLKTLIIPAGMYNVTGSLELPTNLIIKGEGSGQTILRFITPQWPSIPTNTPHLVNAFNMNGISHTGIEDLTIQRYCTPVLNGQFTTDGGCYFHDDLLDNNYMNTGDNICISGSSKCWVTGVESDSPFRHHIVLESSDSTTISGCYFKDVQNRGQGGFGYGVLLTYYSYQCLVENNIFRRNRHGIVLEDGAYNNVVAYNYIRQGAGIQELPDPDNNLYEIHNNYGDINLHGHNDGMPGATHNLIEGNNGRSLQLTAYSFQFQSRKTAHRVISTKERLYRDAPMEAANSKSNKGVQNETL
jgi:parallel beta-helix repeat protein